MDKSQFSRWSNKNIEENTFAIEGIDWNYDLDIHVESTPTGGITERKLVDYRLTIDFAKKLCMTSKSPRGEQPMIGLVVRSLSVCGLNPQRQISA